MTKKTKNLLETICENLDQGTIYSVHHLLTIADTCGFTWNELTKALFDDSKKKNPRILLGFNKEAFLNPKNKTNKKVIKPVKTEIEIIAEAVMRKNKEFIQRWIETEFDKKLEELVQKYVVSEFKEEVLPVLIKHIDDKFKNTQESHNKSIKTDVIKVLSDMIIEVSKEETLSNED